MPRATVNIAETQRFELKSLPTGYVVLKKMSYGQILARQEMAMRVQMQMASRKQDPTMEIKNANQEVAVFEFSHSIVDHNLEDEQGARLDFKQAMSVIYLDPAVGQEIADNIMKINNLDGEELGNSSRESNGALTPPDTSVPSTMTTPSAISS